jgi:hypothetical protein
MDNLKKYINIEEKTETLYSILIYNKNLVEIIKYIEEQIGKAKNITNSVVKYKINNRLFLFLNYVKENYKEDCIINSIFLINDEIISYELNNNEINTLLIYNIQKIFIKTDNKFYIDYFIDLFYNFDFIYSIKLNKNELYIIKLNKNKEKELDHYKNINENNIIDSINKIQKEYNYKDYIILFGISPLFAKIDNTIKNIIIHKNFINKSEIFNIYDNENIKKNNLLLQKRLDDIKNEKTNLDLYIFGKLKIEIKDAIELYLIKELYIEDKKLEKLKTFVDESFLNFKIISIKSLEKSDIADIFIRDYNGIMGIKYY